MSHERQRWASIVRELRKRLNLSQEELAAKLRVTSQSISRWETMQLIPSKPNQVKILAMWEGTLTYHKTHPSLRDYQWAILIRLLRKRATLSQRELAGKLGVASDTVSRWETSQSVPTAKYQKKLLDLWGTFAEETFDYHYLAQEVIVILKEGGRRALVRVARTITPMLPKGEFLWEAFSDGPMDTAYVTPGHITRTFRKSGKVYYVQEFGKQLQPGDSLRISLECEAINAFLADDEWFAFEIVCPTSLFAINIRFGEERLPKSYTVRGGLKGVDIEVPDNVIEREANGGRELKWEVSNPELYATYALCWSW